MSSNNSLTARLDELRARMPPPPLPTSSSNAGSAAGQPTSASRYSASFMPSHAETPQSAQPPSPGTPHLQRRFTTDLSRMNTVPPADLSASVLMKAQLLEKKKQEFEVAAEQRRHYQSQLQLHSQQEAREKAEIEAMTRDLQRAGLEPGQQSEPTTPPPERRDNPFGLGRTSRYSTSSFASPSSTHNRASRSGSLLTSPPRDPANGSDLPSKSVPASRRASTDRYSSSYMSDLTTSGRRLTGPNRYSMPVVHNRAPNAVPENAATPVLESLNTTSFLFDDDEKPKEALSPDVKHYLHMGEDNFPVLIRRENTSTLSAPSAALDLALNPEAESTSGSTWGSPVRQRLSLQQTFQPLTSPSAKTNGNAYPENKTFHPNRHSMEARMASHSHRMSTDRPSLTAVHPSYSTSDVPTMKTVTSPSKGHSLQFHNHNASLGRIPSGSRSGQHSRTVSINTDFQRSNGINEEESYHSPTRSLTSPLDPSIMQAPYYSYNYGLPFALPPDPLYPPAYLAYPPPNFPPTRKRVGVNEEYARLQDASLEGLRHEIVSLCKDQHGCRYLQKKLDERDPVSQGIIFSEIQNHVVELMTDPFGNYLCQKMFELATNDQRSVLVRQTAPHMMQVAMNSHGTRALQKLIDSVNTAEQIHDITQALDPCVVQLIQDLNGNHVIQKCLNRLAPEEAQFIFDAVGLHCIAVGTHRHGCCVLQRCIDHASETQKSRLIAQITEHAFHLVQDPFGNYVLQYIVDLQQPGYTNPLCGAFHGHVPQLSKQKFSSNVIEKCLRGAHIGVTQSLIEEMLNPQELERMLRDAYANYVVQTAMDYADPATKTHLVEAIRPILAAVRHTPHGRRIQSKIAALDGAPGRPGGFGGDRLPATNVTRNLMTYPTTYPVGMPPDFAPSSRSPAPGMYGEGGHPSFPGGFPGGMQHVARQSPHQQAFEHGGTSTPFVRPAYAQGGFF